MRHIQQRPTAPQRRFDMSSLPALFVGAEQHLEVIAQTLCHFEHRFHFLTLRLDCLALLQRSRDLVEVAPNRAQLGDRALQRLQLLLGHGSDAPQMRPRFSQQRIKPRPER